ncbi:hypothetical protein [uncultured Corynebacterium sp.]|uniref:hypothetical protein n=1 Tax=uncultured Corynebacterium sp. TaxID=159447 RepID=UPI00262B2ABC|nr:hypothetical protein [uncultured Corynebacterium sp.]
MDRHTMYSESLAGRILGGSGALALVPYRIDPSAMVPVVAHLTDLAGRLLVLCPTDEAEYIGATEVRIDGTKKAPELSIDITVASLHALGRVEWLDAADPAFGLFPLADAGAFTVGAVTMEKVLVHGPCGVVKLDPRALPAMPARHPLIADEVEARDVVGVLSPGQLRALLSDVLVGFIPGFRCSEFEAREAGAPAGASAAGAPAADGATARAVSGANIWVADVDPAGLTLATLYGSRITSVFVDFAEPAATISDLARAVDALAARTSARHASPRI